GWIPERWRRGGPRWSSVGASFLAAWGRGGAPAGPGTAAGRNDEQPESTVVSMMVRKRTPTWRVRSKGPATTVKPGCAASGPPPTDQLVTRSVSFERTRRQLGTPVTGGAGWSKPAKR